MPSIAKGSAARIAARGRKLQSGMRGLTDATVTDSDRGKFLLPCSQWRGRGWSAEVAPCHCGTRVAPVCSERCSTCLCHVMGYTITACAAMLRVGGSERLTHSSGEQQVYVVGGL